MLTKEYLQKAYITEEKSTPEIARESGCSAPAVNYWLRKHGIKVRDKFDPICRRRMAINAGLLFTRHNLNREYLEKEFITNKKTINQIAHEFGCSWDTVRKRLMRLGFPMRLSDAYQKSKRKRTAVESKQFQKRLLRLYGYKCAICGYDKFVNCHHVERWAKTENNSVENGIVLCPNHHAEADYGIISPEELRHYQLRESPTL